MGYSRKKLDLTGQRFGKLTVLAPAEKIGQHTAWLCRCECGRQAVVATRKLRGGETRSCGCLKPGGIPHPTCIDGTSPEMLAAAKIARKNNTSGVPGVDWRAAKELWRATICFKGKRHYTAGHDLETGKAIYKNVLAKTQKECKEKLSAALEQAGKVDASKTNQYTVGQWAKAWFENYAKPSI